MSPTFPYVRTFSGRRIMLDMSSEPSDYDISDIAWSLAHQCRWNGHTLFFYSVADHSVDVAARLDREGASPMAVMAGLLHDAAEAYLGDVPQPVKKMEGMERYCEVENMLVADIMDAHGVIVDHATSVRVKHADTEALLAEAVQLFPTTPEWLAEIEARLNIHADTRPLYVSPTHTHARYRFLSNYHGFRSRLDKGLTGGTT